MKSLLKVFFLMYITLCLGVICIGCSKKNNVNETLKSEDTTSAKKSAVKESTIENSTVEASTVEDSSTEGSTTKDSSGTEGSDVNVESVDNSPWKLISESNVETSLFYAGFLNDKIGVTVGYEGAISYTEDGGKTWSKSSNVSACRYGLDLYNESFIISSGNSGVNLISRDKGRTWYRLGDFPLKSSNAYNKFLSIIEEDNIYIGAVRSLGYSNDKGNTWAEMTLPEECSKIVGMYFITKDIGYLLCGDGTLYKTNDGCKTWTPSTIDLSGESFINATVPSAAINFQDEDHGMIVYITKTYKIICIKTEDGGKTWTSIEMPQVALSGPYLSRDGKYLTLSSATKKVALYKLEDE